MANPTIRMLWGLAKSQELCLTDEELHLLVSAHTGKDSIRSLNKRELETMVGKEQTETVWQCSNSEPAEKDL